MSSAKIVQCISADLECSRCTKLTASCFEEMTDDDVAKGKITYDTDSCRNGLHKECWNMWAGTAVYLLTPPSWDRTGLLRNLVADGQKQRGASVTCVWCRASWPGSAPDKGKGKVPGRPGATGLSAIG